MPSESRLLEGTPNPFAGIDIDPAALPRDGEEFRSSLSRSLDEWQSKGFKVVWLELPLERAAFVPIAAEAGFGFHHSAEDYVMMTRRLVPNATIPAYSTHYIGAGGVVVNSRRELLVVCERHRRTSRRYLKLPGGALQAGEHLADAVVREVLEETGVHARFEAVVCFRHWHGYRHGKSDIYFVCRLSPESEEITMQTDEIEECFWMPVDEFLASDLVSVFNRQIVQAAMDSRGLWPAEIEGYAQRDRYEFFMPGEA